MSDYLSNLVGRSLNLIDVIRPRSVSMFEPPPIQANGTFFEASRAAGKENDEPEAAISNNISRRNYGDRKKYKNTAEQIVAKNDSKISLGNKLSEAQPRALEDQSFVEEDLNVVASAYELTNVEGKNNSFSHLVGSNERAKKNIRSQERSKTINSLINKENIPEKLGISNADDHSYRIANEDKSHKLHGLDISRIEGEGSKLERQDNYSQTEPRYADMSERKDLERKDDRFRQALIPDIEPDPITSFRMPFQMKMQTRKDAKEEIHQFSSSYHGSGIAGLREISDPIVQVTIGRIEVKANQQLTKSNAKHSSAMAPSLDEYLKRRADGGIR